QGQGNDGRGKVDVALLRLEHEADGDRGEDPEWASIGRSDRQCEAIGYPVFMDEARRDGTDAKDPEVERFSGKLEPYAGLEHGRLNAKHQTVPRQNEDWAGISGAAL